MQGSERTLSSEVSNVNKFSSSVKDVFPLKQHFAKYGHLRGTLKIY